MSQLRRGDRRRRGVMASEMASSQIVVLPVANAMAAEGSGPRSLVTMPQTRRAAIERHPIQVSVLRRIKVERFMVVLRAELAGLAELAVLEQRRSLSSLHASCP